jgi:molybdenum cofactor guanylyltransferase
MLYFIKKFMQGIVLCGGKSTRMGSDKGLLQLHEKYWAQIAAEKLSALNIPVKLSVNDSQVEAYKNIFSTNDFITDDKGLLIEGPLLGLMSCHLASPEQDLFVLACDLLNIEATIMSSLYKKYQQQNFDAYIGYNNNEAEPLCGIYTAQALKNILHLYTIEKLYRYSMKFILEQLNVCRIDLSEEEKLLFKNFNSPGDF